MFQKIQKSSIVPKKPSERTLDPLVFPLPLPALIPKKSQLRKTVKPNLLSFLVTTKALKTMVAKGATLWKHHRLLASKVGRIKVGMPRESGPFSVMFVVW